MPHQLFRQLLPYVTVHARRAGIDPQAASPVLLAAIAGEPRQFGDPMAHYDHGQNAAGKPIKVTNPGGTTTTYVSVMRKATETSSSGRRVKYTYDLAAQPWQTIDGVSGTLDPSITVSTSVRSRANSDRVRREPGDVHSRSFTGRA